MHALLAIASETKFLTIIGTLTGILALVSAIGRVVWKTTKLIIHQVEAIEANTIAVRELSRRVAKIEGGTHA